MKCRYLEGFNDTLWCAYYDNRLYSSEAVKCSPGGWDCYEEDSEGVIWDQGVWKTLAQFLETSSHEEQQMIPWKIKAACSHPKGAMLPINEGKVLWCGLCGFTLPVYQRPNTS